MSLLSSTYSAARIGADVSAGVSGSAASLATRAQNKFVGRMTAGAVTGGKMGRTQYGAPATAPAAMGVGVLAGVLPGRRKLVAGLFNAARSLNDLQSVVSGSPTNIATRFRNKVVGRMTLQHFYRQAKVRGKDQVVRNLLRWEGEKSDQLTQISNSYAKRMEAYAKANAPWQDRTGRARRGLFGRVRTTNQAIMTGVAHSVSYGVFLETGFHGRYAILLPTANHFASDYFRDVGKLVGS